jgi:DNA polymerase-3 subunit epsilon
MKFRHDRQRRAVFANLGRPAGRRRKRWRVTVVDTETTGLTNRDRLIEVAAISKDASGYSRYHTMVRPPVRINSYASAVHGITWKDVKYAPVFSEVRSDIQRIVDCSDKVVAQNANFDVRFLRNEGIRIEDGKVRDTMKIGKEYTPPIDTGGDGRLSLDDLTKGLGVEISAEERHSAYGDALGTLRCYEIMTAQK